MVSITFSQNIEDIRFTGGCIVLAQVGRSKGPSVGEKYPDRYDIVSENDDEMEDSRGGSVGKKYSATNDVQCQRPLILLQRKAKTGNRL